jgi:hypothetical protein
MGKFETALAAVAVTAAVLVPASSAFADAPLPKGQKVTYVDHYTQGSQGSTVTTTTDLNGNSIMQPFTVSAVPYDWTIDYDSTLRARDMTSADGNFCQRYRSDSVADPAATPYSTIQLIKNVSLGSDDPLESYTFPNNGGLYAACWPHHSATDTYHFEFTLPNFGYYVTAHGTAYEG